MQIGPVYSSFVRTLLKAMPCSSRVLSLPGEFHVDFLLYVFAVYCLHTIVSIVADLYIYAPVLVCVCVCLVLELPGNFMTVWDVVHTVFTAPSYLFSPNFRMFIVKYVACLPT
jgi:hypothetical protein